MKKRWGLTRTITGRAWEAILKWIKGRESKERRNEEDRVREMRRTKRRRVCKS